jgi:hypothetical protein
VANWKTLQPRPKDERAIVAYLRPRAPAFLAPLTAVEPAAA